MELYIHIPFCVRKCRYCAFTSFIGQEAFYEEYTDLILKEAEIRHDEASGAIHTIYLGGGTPSLFPASLLRKLITGLRKIYPIEKDAEFTAEANPGTVRESWLETAADLGVNRLSFGMQAFQPRLLQILGRIHLFEDVVRSVELSRSFGIHNINLDLMFGIPTQSCQEWTETLNMALTLHPVHLSAYGLIPEDGTPLYSELKNGSLVLPDPDSERQMYDDAITVLRNHEYMQYEISSFARKGYECRHNTGYWTQVPYLGFGVSAASMSHIHREQNGISYIRRTNPDTLPLYSSMIRTNAVNFVSEKISPSEARFETLMLGLRMNRGIDEQNFLKMHGLPIEACYGKKLSVLEEAGLLTHEHGSWKMTRRGFDVQNSILVELMD